MASHDDFIILEQFHRRLQVLVQERESKPICPTERALEHASTTLATVLPETGISLSSVSSHLLDTVLPGLPVQTSPRYYGFVTGATTPAARLADEMVSVLDQNVQVHLPQTSVATTLEHVALNLLLDLFHLPRSRFTGNTFTTGATASNVLGMACGLNAVLRSALESCNVRDSPNDLGVLRACTLANIHDIQVLTTTPHSSLLKAASMVGLGRAAVKLCADPHRPHAFSMQKLRAECSRPHTLSIISVSAAEVNSGFFATNGTADMHKLCELRDEFGAWIHVDGAFGLFGRLLLEEETDDSEFAVVRAGVSGLELADSITGDAHKLLNVPYDCGFFFCRDANVLADVCANVGAAYLQTNTNSKNKIHSPLHITIENSRRFRALPVYATLISHGRHGYVAQLKRQIRLARRIAEYLYSSPDYILLPAQSQGDTNKSKNDGKTELDIVIKNTFIIVLFRAHDPQLNAELDSRINKTGQMWVSATEWMTEKATRIAVANWAVDVERDFAIVSKCFDDVVAEWKR